MAAQPVAIVIAEDQPLIRMAAADHLLEAGYRVLEADDAEEALTILEARPDVRILVTDVKMPGEIDGIALAHIVARRWSGVGIVVTSGHAVPGPGDLPAGAVFLAKPYSPSELLGIVAGLLQKPGDTQLIAVEAAIVLPEADAGTDALAPKPNEAEAKPRLEKDGE